MMSARNDRVEQPRLLLRRSTHMASSESVGRSRSCAGGVGSPPSSLKAWVPTRRRSEFTSVAGTGPRTRCGRRHRFAGAGHDGSGP